MDKTALFLLPAPFAVVDLGKRLAGLEAGPQRRAILREILVAAPELPLVRVLGCAQREAASGSRHGTLVFDVFTEVLRHGDLSRGDRERWCAAASHVGEAAIERLLEFEDETPEIIETVDPPRGTLAAEGVTLGHRKAIARSARGDTLMKLMRDPEPSVIAEVLKNGRLTEAQVVRMAAQQKPTAGTLAVIGRSDKIRFLRVRRALVTNPETPAHLACTLMSRLPRSDLQDVALDTRLDDEVRNAARDLLVDKPPHPMV